jgi:hypothetical protein
VPCRYGLVHPLRSNNPVFIAFHEWIALGRDLWQAQSWRDRWSYLFGPPGWQPERQPSQPEIAVDADAPARRPVVEGRGQANGELGDGGAVAVV